jgi:hypothetical protein
MSTMENSDTEQEVEVKKEDKGIPRWAIYTGIGLTGAIAIFTTIYVVKSKRKNELNAMKYDNETLTIEAPSFFSRISKSLGLAKTTYSSVKNAFWNFWKPNPVCVDAKQASKTPSLSTSDDGENDEYNTLLKQRQQLNRQTTKETEL